MRIWGGLVGAVLCVASCVGSEPTVAVNPADGGSSGALPDGSTDATTGGGDGADAAGANDAGLDAATGTDAPSDTGTDAAFDPKAQGTLVLWLRADLDITHDASGAVTAWKDQSGTSATHDVAKNPNLPSPQLIAGDVAFGGRDVIEFVNPTTNDTTKTPLLLSGAWAAAVGDPITYYVVARTGTPPGVGMILMQPLAGSAGHIFEFTNGGGSFTFQSVSLATSKNLSIALPAGAAGKPFALSVVASAGNPAIYFTSRTAASTTGTGVLATTVANFVFGGSPAGSVPMQGRIAEILVYSGAHGDAPRLAIMTYLATRYGLSLL